MRKVIPLFWREFKAYFFSPIAYVILTLFFLISGYFFSLILGATREATLRYVLGNMNIVLLFLSPLITMRLLAEEKRTKTIEVLLTDPVTEIEVVLSKFFAALSFYVMLILPTGIFYTCILKRIGNPDLGPIFSGYLGLVLLGSVFLSIGLFASSLAPNQIISAVVGFIILLLFWVIGWSSPFVKGISGKILDYLGFFSHFDTFSKGIINTKDVIYYLTVTILFLFFTIQVVAARRWK